MKPKNDDIAVEMLKILFSDKRCIESAFQHRRVSDSLIPSYCATDYSSLLAFVIFPSMKKVFYMYPDILTRATSRIYQFLDQTWYQLSADIYPQLYDFLLMRLNGDVISLIFHYALHIRDEMYFISSREKLQRYLRNELDDIADWLKKESMSD